jgi:hypothetical protein
MAREEEVESHEQETLSRESSESVCPVCLATVRADQDVLDAHVDACLANENQRLEEERQREAEMQRIDGGVWDEMYEEGAAGHIGNVRGMLSTLLPPSYS